MTVNRTIFFLAFSITSLFFQLFCQDTGLRKSIVDDRTGQTYNNFRSDSTQVLFYQVLVQNDFLYDAPKNNAEAVYTLDSDMFVQIVEDGGSFIRIKILDKFHGIIEGWVRSGTLRKIKYYGRPFGEKNEKPAGSDIDLKKNPHWIMSASAAVYADSSAAVPAGILTTGDLVFVTDLSAGDVCPVHYKGSEGTMNSGFVKKADLSEIALLGGEASTDIKALYDIFNPIILKYDLDRSGFISFKGISFKNKDVNEFTEDRLCKEQSEDTLKYRYSVSSNIHDIKKVTAVRNSEDNLQISMYRFLPDENILTSRDTIKCRVVETASVPRIARIIVEGIEESEIRNSITKIHITYIEKEKMHIVFQRETDTYIYRYRKDISSGLIFDTHTDIEKTVKRMVAFRKH
ncbi:MAG: hypothetical protein PHF33_00765 [Candidatus Delongbacteria bacterium]|nr:hypothetical protein [Candidatus Delongbacteria bacterium]MDD4204907.1 hypothetical protein [Candidatus Delongbacteria bacterium]